MTYVGVKTIHTSRVVRLGRPMNKREFVEQDWYLHPTKGWKRGERRKWSKDILFYESQPRWTYSETYRRTNP